MLRVLPPMRALRWLSLSSLLLLPTLPAQAEELTADRIGQLRAEEKRALDEVAKAYGNRKPSELSREEREAMIRDQAAALDAVLQKHGVDRKDFARASARMSRDEAERAARSQVATEQEQARAAEAAKAPKSPPPVQVQRGVNEGNPVILEESADAPPLVETGIPVEG